MWFQSEPKPLDNGHLQPRSDYSGYADCRNGTGTAFYIDCSSLTSYDGLTAVRSTGLTASKLQSGIQSAGLDNRPTAPTNDAALRRSGETYSECGEGERDHAVFSERPERPLGLATFQREAADCLAVLRQQNRLDPVV